MSSQKPLTQFFKPLQSGGLKRSFAEYVGSSIPIEINAVEKENKVDQTPEANIVEENVRLSPAQKDKMIFNQTVAKIKLQGNKTGALHHNIGHSWFRAVEPEFKKPYFKLLSDFLASERSKHTIFPPEHLIWSWTHFCDIQDIKAVIIGQDPYHGVGQAHGLCFSVLKGVNPPPSLVNIFKELASDIDGFQIPNHGNLSGWARQGVLLLNAGLTVRSGAANSHKDKGWETLTDAVIQWISTNCEGVVFLLWGAYAQKKALVVDKKKHHLLHAPHPSPLSAHRGFLGCKHFSRCNELLIKQNKAPIDWSNLPIE
ncbi:uracil-DNA glycosylase-like [Daphnia carinata]|uniref:uracil-DNA glycosylase-like n=1 Tax=Daphnia carinata TaxID=120202 RepID=UPI00257F24CF|nr:uracil-DNA glycosylase-like [Daphnia carinata]